MNRLLSELAERVAADMIQSREEMEVEAEASEGPDLGSSGADLPARNNARDNARSMRGRPFGPGNPGKPFAPGNPGRPKGARHKTSVAIEALLQGEHEALTRKAIQHALYGNMTAVRICLDRLAPVRRDNHVCFELPPIRAISDVADASAALLAAVADGDVTPEEAGRLMVLLASHRTILETEQREARLAAAEESAE